MRSLLSRHRAALGTIVLALFLLGALTYSIVSPRGIFSGLQNDLKTVGEDAGSAYTDLDGAPVSFERFKGKPLVVNLWATWMPFSKDELRLLGSVQASYGDRVSFVAMNRMEDPVLVRSYLEAEGIPPGLTYLLDPTDRFYTTTGGYAMPETLFYSYDGTLVFRKRGVMTREELEAALARLTE